MIMDCIIQNKAQLEQAQKSFEDQVNRNLQLEMDPSFDDHEQFV